ncbi:hypothetical protein [Chryseobacterium sp.]|uniref:hypothetical protein n=1 Tax=Chryseobacterium sp. TaxID=1871047 RepID=UPI00289A1B4E|nr:hypothetical protein [Chryseobacterium sp.]
MKKTKADKSIIRKKALIIISLLSFCLFFCQQKLEGKILNEDGICLSEVLIVNIKNNRYTYSNKYGEFSIEANLNDEIRFVKNGYERFIIKATNANVKVSHNIVLIRRPMDVGEVKIIPLSGDLSRDSKKLSKVDKFHKLQKDIGLPNPPEIMREKAPSLSDAIQLAIPFGISIQLEALYKIISGDARRMKNLYKYEDMQRDVVWLVERMDPTFFISNGIPKERINEFLAYAILQQPRTTHFIKQKNINGAEFEITKALPEFVRRVQNNN